MTDFDVVKLHCLALEILSQVVIPAEAQSPAAAIDQADEARMKAFRPVHKLSAGMREAKYQRTDRWGDGNPVGYYQAFCRNPETGKFEGYAWRYMLRNGQLSLHKTFPVIVEDWKDRRVGRVDR